MASTEKRLRRGSAGETAGSFHAANCHSSCAEEDPGDLHDPLEEAEAAELHPHVQPAGMVTDPGQIAWRALDLEFPREECIGQVLDEDKKTNSKIICPGKLYPASKAKEIEWEWIHRHADQMGEYWDMCDDILDREDDDDTPIPPFPLKLFPPTTALCALDAKCYHRAYKTHDTSTTPSTLGHRKPQEMLQVFSMRLSTSGLSYPASVYGIFAVRDDLDPRRNYVFNCPREAAVEIVKQESFDLPLCSPCRGMYVLVRALLEVDLWVRKEGGGSDDKHILSAYAEIEMRSNFDAGLFGRISGDDCNLDLKYMVLARSLEAVVQVYANVGHPRHLRFTALSTGYVDEVVMFDDEVCGSVKLFQRIVAVQMNENLDVLLRVDESVFQWTFHDEYVGPVSCPDDSVLKYGQFFVRVLFAPKNSE